MQNVDYDESGWILVDLNGVEFSVPAYTHQTMIHCDHGQTESGARKILLEYSHWMKMKSWLDEGDGSFLDVGAATGAMTVPFGLMYPAAHIFAFEPHRTVRGILIDTLAKARLSKPLVFDFAISDVSSTVDFHEEPMDESGTMPYLPETSSISTKQGSGNNSSPSDYAVRATTIDDWSEGVSISENCVVKIDIEGFEVHALRGAQKFIAEHRPRFSIDIHVEPGGNEMTWNGTRAILEKFDYRFSEADHVLFAEPN